MTFTFETEQKEVVDLSLQLQENPTIASTPVCNTCPLAEHMDMMPVQGEGRMGILIVLSHPTKGDFDMGGYMTSQQFTHMANYLDKFGVDINRDCWITSAVRCKTKGQVPEKKVFDCCRSMLYRTVQQKKPFVVFIVGRNAMYGWKGHQFSIPPRVPNGYNTYGNDSDYTRWVINQIPDAEYAFDYNGHSIRPVVMPLFNPADVSNAERSNMKRNRTTSVLPSRQMRMIENGIKLAVQINKDPIAHSRNQQRLYDKHSKTVVIKSEAEAINILKELNTRRMIAFDYETTGIKPYNKAHAIKMVGIADGEYSYAIPFFNSSAFLHAYEVLMTNPSVKKIAHNFKFEYVWTKVKLGFEVTPVYWDTMLASHIIDMREGITGLKMQGYLQFGDAGYEKVTKKLLGPVEKQKKGRKNTNALNWLSYLNPYNLQENAKTWDLLLNYVAEDASLTFALYHKQKQLMVNLDLPHLMKGMKLFMESTVTLADMEMNGFVLDIDALHTNKLEIKKRMDSLKQEMFSTKEYEAWIKVHPDKDINFNSPKQLQEFFFELLKYRPTKFTKSGLPSTDKEALTDMGSEFGNKLLEYNVLDKLANSFLTSYEMEMNEDGHIRSIFNLNNVTSYRTSASNINAQQVSHHSVESKYVLNLLKPHFGHKMLNMDFKSLEVYTSGAHTWMVHDKNNKSVEGTLKRYLDDLTADMHRDIASEIFMVSPEEITKDQRNRSKKFTFGTTYGAGVNSRAHNQWKDMTSQEKAHLAENGIKNYEDFVNHIRQIDYNFWNVRFKEYGIWKRRIWEFYVKYGYFVGMTGFLYTAPDLNERNCLNFGSQGDSAHILLSMANFVNAELKKHKLQSRLICQVHDSLMISVIDSEIPFIFSKVSEFLKNLYKLYPFTEGFNYMIECELSETNGNWGEVEVMAMIDGNKITYLNKEG